MKINSEKNYNFGFIKIKLTINNIFITLTDINGNVIITKRAGLLEFKGSKKKTPYVASQVMKNLILEIRKSNIDFKVYILQIMGHIRNGSMYSIVKLIDSMEFKNIIYLQYLNKRIHNAGLRAKKKRRL